jgi:hypothetical protein
MIVALAAWRPLLWSADDALLYTDNSIAGLHIHYYRSQGSYVIVVLEYIITLEHNIFVLVDWSVFTEVPMVIIAVNGAANRAT